MASVERRHGNSGVSSDEEHGGKQSFHYEAKKGKKKKPSMLYTLIPNFSVMKAEFKQDPVRAIKKILWKLFFYIWCILVLLSILSLLGYHVNPLSSSSKRNHVTSDAGAEEESSEGLWSSMLGDPFGSEDLDKDALDPEADGEKEDDDIPEQVLTTSTVKEGNKVNKKLERELACEELTCIDACNKKIKPKCAKSKSCRNDRDKLCHRRCRKARCEDRCKDEPKFGYVEREQRMDKCKEDCTGPTAAHNKCIKRCHSQFKPCKSRCHEIASKFQCPTQPPIMTSMAEEESDPAPIVESSKSRHLKSRTLELLEDPEMI